MDKGMFSISRPFKLASNRVWRTYTGGELLERWANCDEPADGHLPEEWIASVTRANNPGREYIRDEGCSLVELDSERKIPLIELIGVDPEGMLGAGHVAKYGLNTALLVKLLDSAERLTIQVHPDDDISMRLFGSRFGKTEAWYILGKRSNTGARPYVLFGFKPGMTREKWVRLFEEQDIDAMAEALHKIYIEPGQVYLVEGGIPHAIGPGCFILEIQQPTDYTIRVEKRTPLGREIPDKLCHQGVGFDKMFDCFKFDTYSEEEILNRWRIHPEGLKSHSGFMEQELIGYGHTPHFRMVSAEVSSEYLLEQCPTFSSLVVLSGEGELHWEGEAVTIRQGETYFLPASLRQASIRSTLHNPVNVIRCYPPK